MRIKTELGLTHEQFGWVLAAFSLSYALFEIPSGALGDRIGPRAVFIRIVLLWSFFTAVTGLVSGLALLLVVRFLFGMGESGTYPNILLVVSRWFPSGETGRALTWVGIGSQIGSAIAPLMIVPIAVAYGWRMPFFVNAAIGGIWVLICYYWFRDFPAEMKKITPQEKTLIESERRFTVGHSLVPWKIIFSNPTLWALMLMYFCCQWANYFFVAWMPVYLQEGRQFSENEMKTITFILFIAGIAGFLLGGFAGDALVKTKGLVFGRRFVGLTGLGLCGILILFAAILTDPLVSAACLIGANFCFSFGVMVSYAVCSDIGRNNAGTVTGAMNFFGQMGAFTLSVVFGKMVDVTHDFNKPLFLVAAVMVTGGLLWFAIDPTRQLKHTEGIVS
jgi:sugar phosphate permease